MRELVGPSFGARDKRILFVFGAARSGTTLLNQLLYHHFGYGTGAEGTFIAEFAKKLSNYGSLENEKNLNRLIQEISRCEMLNIARYKYKQSAFDVTPQSCNE